MKANLYGMIIGLVVCAVALIGCDQGLGKDSTSDDQGSTAKILPQAVIGRGYDVSGHYADSQEIKGSVLDYTALTNANLIIQDTNIKKSEFRTVSGSEIHSFQNDLAVAASLGVTVGVPDAASFSTEVGTRFTETHYSSNAYAFATSSSRINKEAYYIDGREDPASLRAYASASFIEDVATLSATELITKYGTHVMLGGIWGARLDHSISAQKKAGKNGESIAQYVNVSASGTIQGINVGVTAKEETEQKFMSEFETSTVKTTTAAYGGAPEYAQAVHQSGNYDNWIDSIEANPVWCDYYANSLQPISAFIEDSNKRDEVAAGINTYLSGKIITVKNEVMVYKTKSIPGTFTEYGFTAKADNNNDGDIGSGTNKKTHYSLVMNLSLQSETEIKVDTTLTVWEDNGGYNTKFSGAKSFTFTSETKIDKIDCITTKTFSGLFTTKVRNETITLTGNNECPFVTKLVVGLDGDSVLDDTSAIGFSADFSIPIGYWEKP